jgi:methylmalonyl-CoA mutase C-terminal domain/subunit
MANESRSASAPVPASAVGPALGMRFHHVGVAVRSIEEALQTYIGVFGFERVSDPIEVEHEHVRVCFLRAGSGVMIELVEGVDDESPVRQLLQRTGAGTYHICYRVDDLDRAIRELRAHRCFPFKRFEVEGQQPRRFAFLLTPDRQLFELCEAPATEMCP